MKKAMTLTALALCAGLMSGPAVADTIHFVNNIPAAPTLRFTWAPASCEWPGGCRYTYQVPNPPAGKRWVLEVSTNILVNDGTVWMKWANSRKAMVTTAGTAQSDYSKDRSYSYYRGHMTTGGEIEFWMPMTTDRWGQNRAWITGTLL